MVSNFLLARWLRDVKHILLLMVRKKAVPLTKNIYFVKYMYLCSFTSSSGTGTMFSATGIGFFLVVFHFKDGTLLPHIM